MKDITKTFVNQVLAKYFGLLNGKDDVTLHADTVNVGGHKWKQS